LNREKGSMGSGFLQLHECERFLSSAFNDVRVDVF
jgi:hypothetical protein